MFEDVSPKVSLQSKMADFNRLRRQKSVSPRKQIISLLVVAVITGSSFFFAQRLTRPVSNPQNSSAAGVNTVNLMEIYYIPPNTEFSNRQGDVFNKSLATKVYIENASAYHGDKTKQMISFNNTKQYVRTEFRPEVGDYRANLIAILNDTKDGPSACELIEQQKLDQVWVWFDDNADLAAGREWMINNVTSNYGNSDINKDSTICKNTTRTFSVLGLAYNRFVTNAVHSFGHFMEGLITGIEGFDMLVGRFEGVQSYQDGGPQSGRAGAPIPPYKLTEKCGRVHVPPNVPFDTANNYYPGYTYQLTNTVDSTCSNWTPDGTGPKTPVGLATWFNNPIPSTSQDSELNTFNVSPFYTLDELHFLTWWMQQFPHESSGVSFEGKRLPSWWALVANTDDVLNAYIGLGYWFKPDLIPPVAAKQTAVCTGTSGYYSSCTYTPGSSTLGAHTENDKVLAATTYGEIALVTVAYGNNTGVTVSNITFCGDPMTRVGSGPSNGGGMKTEMWYRLAPQSGVCPVTVRFSSDPGQRIVTTTIFNNIDQVTPVTGITTGGFSGPYTATPGSITATLTGPKDSLMVCTYALYSEQSNPPSGNNATANPGTTQLWKFEQPNFTNGPIANVWAGIGAGIQRANANQSTTLSWKTVKQQPQSYTCANFNVKPFPVIVPVTPAPTPVPTTTVAPTPTAVPTKTPVATPAPTATPTVAPTTYLLVPKDKIVATATSQHVGYEAAKSLDTLTTTFWHSEWSPYAALPQHVLLTLPNTYKVGKIGYLPRQDGGTNGNITGYKILVSADGITNTVAAQGTWADNQTLKSVEFTPINAKYVAVVATSGNGGYASAAELAVWYVGTPATATPVPTATPAPTVTPSTAPTTLYAIPQYTMAVAGTSQQAGYEANKVLDVNGATLWHSAWSPYAALPQWLTFTLPSLSSVAKIEYLPRQDGGINGNITSYYVLASADGLTNTVVAQGTWADDQTLKSISFTPFKAKYIALVVTAGHGNYASASEINIYKTEAPVISATATSSHVGYEPSKAIDGNSATMWHSDWNPYFALPQSITLNLGTQRRVSQISYAPRQDGSTAGLITSYKIYTSTNGITFTLVTSGTWPSDFTTKTATFASTTATHIKLEAVVGGLGYASASEVYIPQIVGGPFPINVTGK